MENTHEKVSDSSAGSLDPARLPRNLDEFSPSRSAAYSPNLYAWLKAHGCLVHNSAILCTVYKVVQDRPALKSYGFQIGNQLIGYTHEGDFIGARLNQVLCNGADAPSWCYPGCAAGVASPNDFWAQYRAVGRCAIDPDHQMLFSDTRYRAQAHSRACMWCGHVQERVQRARTVIDERWQG